ncbi:MAG TPA: hypothetical protein VGJ46_10700, partial [Candidatus Limnocylindrales bacterium]
MTTPGDGTAAGRDEAAAGRTAPDRPPWWPADEAFPPLRPDGRPDWRQVRERASWGWWSRGREYGWARRGYGPTGPPWARRWGRRQRGFGCLFGVFFLLAVGSVVLLVTSVVLGLFGVALGGRQPGPLQVAAFVVLAACIGGALVAGRLLQRSGRVLDEVLSAITRLEAGDYAARVRLPRRGPLPVVELVRGFNTMAERLE